ncbi:YegP family protein [Arthrobacter bambusae]|nr:YegP family protein [Arthrobacter bambusae]
MFELFIDEDTSFRFRLKAPDGTVVAVSKSFPDKRAAVRGISDVREYAGMGLITDLCPEVPYRPASVPPPPVPVVRQPSPPRNRNFPFRRATIIRSLQGIGPAGPGTRPPWSTHPVRTWSRREPFCRRRIRPRPPLSRPRTAGCNVPTTATPRRRAPKEPQCSPALTLM